MDGEGSSSMVALARLTLPYNHGLAAVTASSPYTPAYNGTARSLLVPLGSEGSWSDPTALICACPSIQEWLGFGQTAPA